MKKSILLLVLLFFITGCNIQNQTKLNAEINTISIIKVKHYTLQKYVNTHQKELNTKNDTILGKVQKKYLKLLHKPKLQKNEYIRKKVYHIKTPLASLSQLDNHPVFKRMYPSSTKIIIIYHKNKAIINYFYKDPCYQGSKDYSYVGGNDLIVINSQNSLTKYSLGGYCAYGCPVQAVKLR